MLKRVWLTAKTEVVLSKTDMRKRDLGMKNIRGLNILNLEKEGVLKLCLQQKKDLDDREADNPELFDEEDH